MYFLCNTFFPSSFLYLSSLTLSPSKTTLIARERERPLSSPTDTIFLSLSLFLLLFVVLSARRRAHTNTHTLAVTLSRSSNCQKFPISRDSCDWCSRSLRLILVCLLICFPVFSHKSVAAGAGALQRNFLPFIAQHIFFGTFFLFFYALRCLLGGFDFSFTGISARNRFRSVQPNLFRRNWICKQKFEGLKILTDFDPDRTFYFL